MHQSNTKTFLESIQKNLFQIGHINQEVTMTFLQSIAIKAIYDQLLENLGDNNIVKEEIAKLNSIHDENDLEGYYLYFNQLRENKSGTLTEDTEKRKDIKKLKEKFRETKSQVIKKNIIKSICIKNILIRLHQEDYYQDCLQNLHQ